MSRIGTALRAFARAWRAPKGPVSELREFVYLDETSVESLLASLDGEVLVGTTQTRGRVGELGVGATGDAVGVPTGLAPSFKVGRSSSVQEERKSVAQSAFARLRARQLSSMPVAVGAGQPGRDGVQIDNLHRGDLVEVAVRLEGADVFQVQAVIRSMIEVVNSYPDLLEANQRAAILNGEPIAALLESLSRGLIPIEGEAIDLQVVDRDGKAFLVSGASHESGLPLRIAGVTLEGLYWQDVRRVLFSRGEYRMLVRLLHDGVRERWSPVKITEILSQVSSDLAATIDGLGPTFLGSLRDGARRTIVSEDLKTARIAALTDFAARLRSAAGAAELDRHTGSRVASIAAQVSSEAREGAEWWKGALNRVADAALGEDDERVSSVDLAALRSQVAEPTLQGSAAAGDPSSTPHLEVEVVAIYW